MDTPEANKAGPTSSFVGREKAIAEITERLVKPNCHLLSLIGPGGIGKTRLARKVAREVKPEFSDGVYLVPLQSAAARTELIDAVADAVGTTPIGQQNAELELQNHLQSKNLLLLLDNFEHLVPVGGTDLLASLLVEAPEVKIMVTSRQALNLQEEWRYPVKGLPVPDSRAVKDPEMYPAVQLFRDRARRVRPDFSLEEELDGVIRLCHLTEGIPLALELAASWVQALSCRAIGDEIERNQDFLATTLRNVPERHRRMQSVFDHSWKLMSERERRVFRRLSVFHGDFDRAAANAVADATPSDLTALVDQSLLQRDSDGRYHLHELLRQYGNQQLHTAEEEAIHSHQRHCAYYASFLEGHLPDLHGGDQINSLRAVSEELDNVRAAWQWAVAQSNVDAVDKAASSYFLYCQMRSRYREGAQALGQAAASLAEMPASQQRDRALVRLHNHAAWLWIRMGEFERAKEASRRSRALYTQPDLDPLSVMGGDPRSPLAIVAAIQGDHEQAASLGHEVRSEAEGRDDPHNLPFAHYVLTVAESARGNYEAAHDHAERACNLSSSIGNEWFLAYPLNEWGHVERALGDYDQAKKHYRASYAIKESFDDAQGMAVALNHLGEIALRQGNAEEAKARFLESRDIYQEIHDPGGLASCLKGLGRAEATIKDFEPARRNFLQALDIAIEIRFTPLILDLFIEVDPLLHHRRAQSLTTGLLRFVVEHPAADHETRTEATRRLERQETQLAQDAFARGVARGQEWDLDQATMALKAELTSPSGDHPERTVRDVEEQRLVEPLTDRELEVLALLAKGYTNPQIAEELVIALGTVKWYASEIYGKLGVNNRTQAAHRAHELGVLPLNEGQGLEPQPS